MLYRAICTESDKEEAERNYCDNIARAKMSSRNIDDERSKFTRDRLSIAFRDVADKLQLVAVSFRPILMQFYMDKEDEIARG